MGQEPTSETLYAGTFERSLDAKKRVSIPSAWVAGEGEVFHVVPHPDGYLMVMGRDELARWEKKFQESTTLSAVQKRIAIRKFYGDAHAVTTDKQGRILLPDKHCAKAGLTGEVVFIGAQSRIEIWSAERYEATAGDNASTFQIAAEAVGL
jgi:MraZ protein